MRAIAILFVVAFHVVRGALNSGLLTFSPALAWADASVYVFHVPVFFLIAGYLGTGSEATPARFWRRLALLAYAYVLWSVLTVIASMFAGDRVNVPLGWEDTYSMVSRPIQHYWFLSDLILAMLAATLLRSRLALAIAILAALALSAIGLDWWLSAYLFTFLAIGKLWRGRALPTVDRRLVILALLVWAGTATLAVGHEARLAPFFPGALAGCYLVASLAQKVAGPARVALVWLGARSMPIFLSHVLFAAAVRVALVAVSAPPGLTIILSGVAGVVGPLLLGELSRRYGLSELLAFAPIEPWPVGRASSAADREQPIAAGAART